jgi:NAD(P)-dependent dehydrogenase (short-subunit alcohol dehydrogenase family)
MRRTVVVTGASSGIGLCTAQAFARRGDDVVLVARDGERLAEAARRCESLGGRALAVPGDVTEGDRMRQVVAAAVAAFGQVDVWVNNAGTSLWGAFEDIPLATHRQLIAVDLLGVLNGAHAIVPHFLANGGTGVIINVVSIGGRLPARGRRATALPSSVSRGSPRRCALSWHPTPGSRCAASIRRSPTRRRQRDRATTPGVRCGPSRRWCRPSGWRRRSCRWPAARAGSAGWVASTRPPRRTRWRRTPSAGPRHA